jgi:amino acid adenylation domain-containing protein
MPPEDIIENSSSEREVNSSRGWNTLSETLRFLSISQPDKTAFVFLDPSEKMQHVLSYGDLHKRALAASAAILARCRPGNRVMLCHPSGLEFIIAFFGCLHARVLAVPAYPIRRDRDRKRLQAIALSAGVTLVLTGADGDAVIECVEGSLWVRPCGATDEHSYIGALLERTSGIHGDVAYLQYTSGSTSSPKGISITHESLLANLEAIRRSAGHSDSSILVSWLPHFHDMGLVGSLLQPVYAGFPCVFMPPSAFLEKPTRWLRTISDFRGTTSSAPNFAYELCASLGKEIHDAPLDLRTWSNAANGSETVRVDTLERFALRYRPHGFSRSALRPCYGLAECTLLVTAGTFHRLESGPTHESVHEAPTGQNREHGGNAVALEPVGLGSPVPGMEVVIVDPDTLLPMAPGMPGEIWVRGTSVASGYWGKSEESRQIFRAETPALPGQFFLRTGDIGCLKERELFFLGRLKDVLVLRGEKYHPEDIEAAVTHAAYSNRIYACVAVAHRGSGDEGRLMVFLECRGGLPFEELLEETRSAIASHMGLFPNVVGVVRKGALPRTTSGKVMRRDCLKAYLGNELPLVHIWRQEDGRPDRIPPERPDSSSMVSALVEWICETAESGASQVETGFAQSASVWEMGFDSIGIINLKHLVERKIGLALPSEKFFLARDLGSLADLVRYGLRGSSPESRSGPKPATLALSTGMAPATSEQFSVWYWQTLHPENPAFHISIAGKMRGQPMIQKLVGCIVALSETHPSLKARFIDIQGNLQQEISNQGELTIATVRLPEIDWWQLGPYLDREAEKPFDIENGPLFRSVLYQSRDNFWVMQLVAHHMIMDFWSLEILFSELGRLYNGASPVTRKEGSGPLEFAMAKRAQASAEDSGKSQYWKEILSAPSPPLRHPWNAGALGSVHRGSFILENAVLAKMNRIASASGASSFTVLLAAYFLLIHRYTDSADITVGVPLSGRDHEGFSELVALVATIVPMRVRIEESNTFSSLVASLRGKIQDALANPGFHSDAASIRPHDKSGDINPLYQTTFTWQSGRLLPGSDWIPFLTGEPGGVLRFGEFELESLAHRPCRSVHAFSLMGAETPGRITLSFQAHSSGFTSDETERLMANFRSLLAASLENSDIPLRHLPLLSKIETHALAREWSGPARRRPLDSGLLHADFDSQAGLIPDSVCLVFEDMYLTYGCLQRISNALARRLIRSHAVPDNVIGIYMGRGAALVPSILAVLKSSSAYLPLDPALPTSRLRYMLADAGVKMVVAEAGFCSRFPDFSGEIFAIDNFEEWANEAGESPACFASPSNLAYIIYTSGTTGIPKGAMLSHANASRLVPITAEWMSFGREDVLCLFHSFSFDFSVWEIWSALSTGATLCVMSLEEVVSPEKTAAVLLSKRITVLNQTPSCFMRFLGSIPFFDHSYDVSALRMVIFGGEELDVTRLGGLLASSARIPPIFLNMYGITETTVHATLGNVFPAGTGFPAAHTVGRPLEDTGIFVISGSGNLCPTGSFGEICISGPALSRGYLGMPRLTSQKFPKNVLMPGGTLMTRLYRSGDRGCYTRDGQLRFGGRLDRQVKIRGYRVELDEVEKSIRDSGDIRDALVLADSSGSETCLVAYVVLCPGSQATPEELRNRMRKKIPAYSVPKFIQLVPEIPLSTNGKADFRRLPPIIQQIASPERSLPSGTLEATLAGIWAEVLGIEPTGTDGNFFDMGGTSLDLTRFHALIKQKCNADFPISDLFEFPSIRELATYLGGARVEVRDDNARMQRQADYYNGQRTRRG